MEVMVAVRELVAFAVGVGDCEGMGSTEVAAGALGRESTQLFPSCDPAR